MWDDRLAKKAGDNLSKVRQQKPLIHNITNFVVMNYTANALLACGASPVMAHAQEEVEEMVSLAGCLVLNIGTLSPDWVHSMLKAGKRANELKIPIILDPVGSGATTLRTESAKRLVGELSIRVVRGNPSEVLSLAHAGSQTKGVDAIHSVDAAADAASDLAAQLETTIAITGPVDFVTDGRRRYQVFNGHRLMGCVTGTGCTATALIGAFLAVDHDPLEAAATALAYFGAAGEKGAVRAEGPGAFQTALLDALYAMEGEELRTKVKIRCCTAT